MRFYQAMQLSAANLKPLIKNAESKEIKNKYIAALILKSILCLLFCTIVVISFGKVFGEENNVVGVVTVISLLNFRFSNLDFKVRQAALTIVGIFGVLSISPYIASISNPFLGFIINFISIIGILILTCHNVRLCNHSILVLSYFLLYGYKVENTEILINRIIGLIFGGILVASIFYIKQRKIEFKNTFIDIINDVDFNTERTKWQLKFAFVTTSAIMIGEFLHIPRTMWIGIACMSVFHPDKSQLQIRYKQRMLYMVLGCLMYMSIYFLIPQQFRGLIGLIGGVMIGFSGTYKWQTVFNAFGALSAATPILGVGGAIIFRILNNVFGALYSKGFDYIINFIDNKEFANVNEA